MWKRFFPTEEDSVIKTHIDTIANSDPTPNKEYTNWLTREVLNKRLRLPEDAGILNPDLLYFHDLKRRNQLKRLGVESNIDKYTRHQLQDKVDELRAKQTGQSKRQELGEIKEKGAKKLYQDQTWTVLQATTKEACIAYGKGTRWCTAATYDNMADHYLKEGPIYIILKNKEPFAQLHMQSKQFMDVRDEKIHEDDISKDLKEILFKTVPKSTDDEHLFLYELTGKLDPEIQQLTEENTEIIPISDNKWVLKKATNLIAAKLLSKNYSLERLKNINQNNQFYVIENKASSEKIFWTFHIEEPDNADNKWPYVSTWIKLHNPRWTHIITLPTDEYDNYLYFLKERYLAKTINEAIIPKTARESLCLFLSTGLTNAHSDKILMDYVNDMPIEGLYQNQAEYNFIFNPINIIIDYFEENNNPEIFEFVKNKFEEIKNNLQAEYEMVEKKFEENKHDMPPRKIHYMKIHLRELKKDIITKNSKLQPLLGKLAQNKPTPQTINYLLDMAKIGYIRPLYQFWYKTVNSLFKDMDTENPTGVAPWGPNGWPAAEPFIAIGLNQDFHSYSSPKLTSVIFRYSNLTTNFQETAKRLNDMLNQEHKNSENRLKQQQEEDDDFFNNV